MEIPIGPEGLTPEWLTEALCETGTIEQAHVLSFEASALGEGKGIMGQLARLHLEYDVLEEGAPCTLIAKFPGGGQARAHPLGIVPEVMFYRHLADKTELRTPRCYYGAFDESGAFVLLLEDLAPARSGDTIAGCSYEEAALAVREAAHFHAGWWESDRLSEMRWLVGADTVLCQQLIEAYRQQSQHSWSSFLDKVGHRLSREATAIGTRAVEHGVEVGYHLLLRPPRTLVHNDYHLDNLFYASPQGGVPFAVVDWQNIWLGRGVCDVAYLFCRSMPTQDRRRMEMDLLRAYHAVLVEHGVQEYTYEECRYDYRLSMLPALQRVVNRITRGHLTPAKERLYLDVLMPRCCAAVLDLDVGELLSNLVS
jgi:hypothetical protein